MSEEKGQPDEDERNDRILEIIGSWEKKTVRKSTMGKVNFTRTLNFDETDAEEDGEGKSRFFHV